MTVRALVVEDNAEMRFMLGQMLRQLEADAVEGVATLEDAKARMEYGDYQFVVVDIGSMRHEKRV